MAKKTMTEVRDEPGMSNAGTYKDVAKSDFCGPKGTYPVNTLKRAKSALKLAFNAGRGEGSKGRRAVQKIKDCVYRKYPELKKNKSNSPAQQKGALSGKKLAGAHVGKDGKVVPQYKPKL